MLIHGPTSPNLCNRISSKVAPKSTNNISISRGKWTVKCSQRRASLAAVVAAAVVAISSVAVAATPPPPEEETFSNVPQTLSGECALPKDCKRPRIQRPKSRKAESCTSKCVTTCIQGGDGSPGVGPFNIRRPLVVFKEGFRSRKYCLVECSDICNLIGDGDDGP